MNIKEFERSLIKRYLSDEKFVVRIRGENRPAIIVYYNGIKYFDYKNGVFNLNEAVFIPNNTNKEKLEANYIPKNVEKDVDKIHDLNFKFTVGTYLGRDKSKGKKFDLEFSKVREENTQMVNNTIQEIKRFYPNLKCEKILQNEKEKYVFFINKNEIIDFNELYRLLLNGYNKCPSIKFHVDLINNDLSKLQNKFAESFKILDEVMERRIDIYCSGKINHEDDYIRTKEDTNTEKQYQQRLMNIMNNKEKREILCERIFNSKYVKPFEMEYSMYSKKENEEGELKKSTKGRIDNLFVKDNTLIMVELKMGTSVIAGTNGIHKHLLDMCNIFEKNANALQETSDVINERDRILNKSEETKKYAISENSCTELTKKEYYIICGYDKKIGKEIVKNEINRIYNENILSVEMFKNNEDSKMTKDNKTVKNFHADLKKYPKELLNLTVEEYINKLKSYDLPVTIYLANEDYTEIEKYMK